MQSTTIVSKKVVSLKDLQEFSGEVEAYAKNKGFNPDEIFLQSNHAFLCVERELSDRSMVVDFEVREYQPPLPAAKQQHKEYELKRDKRHAALKLVEWQQGQTHFTARVFDLLAKADLDNREKIRLSFPIETMVFEEWRNHPTTEDFKKQYGIGYPTN